MATDTRPSVSATLPKIDPLRTWFPVLLFLAVACAVFGIGFWHEILGAFAVWVESTAYNHCFLVLPLIGALLWNRRSTIALLQPRPFPVALILIPFLLVLWIWAALLGVLEAEQLLIVSLFEVLLLAVLGWQCFRALLAPLLFLFFLVPFGAFLTPTLQQFTTSFTVYGLRLLNIPVFSDGFLIQIPQGSFEVAEACAGLRFLIASIVFGCFFATIIYRSPIRRAMFIGFSIVVPIIANGMRALGLLILAHIEGSASAVAADHLIYGWVFFSLVTLLLIIIGLYFSDGERPLPVDVVAASPATNFKTGATMTVGLLLVLLGPAYFMVIDRAMAVPSNFGLLAPAAGDWVHEPNAEVEWHPVVIGASRSVLETYSDGHARVSQFVALFPLPARDSPLSRSGTAMGEAVNWHIVKAGPVSVLRESNPVALNMAILARQSEHRLVWWFYVVDNQMTASPLMTKLMQARTALRGGSHVGAIVAISTDIDDPTMGDALLTRFLEATGSWRDLHPASLGP